MKKVLLTGLIVSALSSTAFAAAPVTDFQAGESAVQVNYSFAQKNDLKVNKVKLNDMDGKNHIGFALSTALNDKWALQYSYNPLLNSDDVLVAGKKVAPDTSHLVIQSKVKVHQLQGIYKESDNLNLYAGLDYLNSKVKAYGVEVEPNSVTKFSEEYSKNRTGISGGIIAHTKLGDKTTAFAQLGVGSVVKYEAKFGVSQDLSKDVSLVAAYELGKYNLGKVDGIKADLKHRGVNLAVNFKF